MKYRKEFWSFKFKESGLRYEVGLNIVMGDICWWHGPFACGTYHDLTIFQNALQLHLEKSECVEADMGYRRVLLHTMLNVQEESGVIVIMRSSKKGFKVGMRHATLG